MRWIARARPNRRHRVHRRAAAVDGGRGGLLADEALDDLADVDLQRMLRDRGSRRSPSRSSTQASSIAACLPRAVHADPRRLGVLADELVARRGVARPRRRAAEGVFAEAGGSRGCRARPRRAGRCRSGSRSRARGARPRAGAPAVRQASACSGLRLERGRTSDAGSPSRAATVPSAAEDDRDPGVPRLDEAAAFDDGELDGVGCGEGLRHLASLPPGGAGIRVTDCCACSVSIATPSAPRGPATAAPARPDTATTIGRRRIEIDGKPDAAGVIRQAVPRRPRALEPRGPAARGAQPVPPAVVPARVRARRGSWSSPTRTTPPGVMVEDGRGGGAFREVMLRPRVTVADASMTDAATAAHAQAHEWCFIANSVNFPVRHEPIGRGRAADRRLSAARAGGPA